MLKVRISNINPRIIIPP